MVAPKFGDGGGECLRWKRDETQRMLEQHQVADGDSLVRPQRVRVPLEKADMPLGDRRQRTGFVPGGVLAVRPSTPEKRRAASRALGEGLQAAQRESEEAQQIRREVLALQGGKKLGVHVRAAEGLLVMLLDFRVKRGCVGRVLQVNSQVMGESCQVEWADGTRGTYPSGDLAVPTDSAALGGGREARDGRDA
ncbi:hypothetical protein T484DRAFT_1878688, partial [Baffinella frigidus]